MSPNKIPRTAAVILNTSTARKIRETARMTRLIHTSEQSKERKLTHYCVIIK